MLNLARNTQFVRQKEFPCHCDRINGHYFFDSLDSARTLYQVDWGRASEEERAKIRLYQVELNDDAPARLDMRLFDEAFDAMWDREDLETALSCARRYFRGEASPEPIWELLSAGKAVAIRDLTHLLHR